MTTPRESLGDSAFWAVEYAGELTRSIPVQVQVIYLKNLGVELNLWQQHMETQWR